MKKLFFAIALLAMSLVNYAQLGKGRQMIGGNINYTQSENKLSDTTRNTPIQNYKSSTIGVGLHYGYFITDRIMVGATGGFNQTYTDSKYIYQGSYSSSETAQTNQNYSAGIFSRYYTMLGKSKFAVFCQLNLNYGMGTGKIKNTDTYPTSSLQDVVTNLKTTNYAATLSPGITYFITNKFALETYIGSIGYTAQQTKNYQGEIKVNETRTSTFNSNLLFSLSSINIGFNVYFGGKKPAAEPAK